MAVPLVYRPHALESHESQLRQVEKHTSCLQNVGAPWLTGLMLCCSNPSCGGCTLGQPGSSSWTLSDQSITGSPSASGSELLQRALYCCQPAKIMPEDLASTTWWLFLDLAGGWLTCMLYLLKPCRVQDSVNLAVACVCQCSMHCSGTDSTSGKVSWRCSLETATWTQPLEHVVLFTSAGLNTRMLVSTRGMGSWWPRQRAVRSAAAC